MTKKLALEILGKEGRIISASKSLYSKLLPLHVPVFNANVILGEEKVWYGDLDITTEEEKLKQLSEKTGKPVYVLSEFKGRFENENSPILDNYIYKYFKGASYHSKYLKRFTYTPPPAPVQNNRLVQTHVADTWNFTLQITEPEPSQEEIVRRVNEAKAHFKKENFTKIAYPDDAPVFSSFLEGCTQYISPYTNFREWLRTSLSIELEIDDNPAEIYLTDGDYEDLLMAQEAWFKVLGSRFSVTNQDIRLLGPTHFWGAPKGYSAQPDWVQEEHLYVRKR